MSNVILEQATDRMNYIRNFMIAMSFLALETWMSRVNPAILRSRKINQALAPIIRTNCKMGSLFNQGGNMTFAQLE